MGMDMDEVRMILAVRALRKLINKSDRGDGDELVAAYRALAACRTEVYSMIANDSFVGANVHRTRDRAQSALLRSPIELASRCLGCI